jgi:hypothetical protein
MTNLNANKTNGKYYATHGTEGTEETIVINSPEGQPMASVSCSENHRQSIDNASLILKALNAYKGAL